MTAPVIEQTKLEQRKLDSLLARAIGDLSAGCGGVLISIGNKLGLFKGVTHVRRAAETPFNLILEVRR